MRVGLFVPCFVNDFYPEAAMSTLEVLETHGCDVIYPEGQSCCGQPLLNNGLREEAVPLAERFVDLFGEFDYVVSPSSSCIATVKYRYEELVPSARYRRMRPRLYEFCEFLHDVIGVERLRFHEGYRGVVGLHNSCHALRELELAAPSERNLPHFSKIEAVLSRIEGLEIRRPSRDECCGFGGTFSVGESELSVAMGRERIADHLDKGVEVMAGVDMSCLMHMEGIARREGTSMGFVHVAQLMTGRL